MKKVSIMALLAAFSVTGTYAQKTADFSKVDPNGVPTDAFYFYLPRTAVDLEFTVTENRYTKGELAAYTAQYFQSKPENDKNRSSYGIQHISVLPYAVPDPTQQYRYSAATAAEVSIQTVAGGIIKSINAPIDAKNAGAQTPKGAVSRFTRSDDETENRVPFFSLGVRSDTVIAREITPDSTIIERRVINRRTVSNTPEEMAKESVQKLDEIRKIRYALISGPEDVMLDGQGLATSLKELERTEQALLELFFGRSKKITQTYRITYIPTESADTLFFLSVDNGVSMVPGPGALPVRVMLRPLAGRETATPAPAVAQSGVIPYRSAQKMVFSIQWNGAKYFETELDLPQYGQVHAVPLKKLSTLQIIYNEQTGAIERIGPK